MQAARGRAGLLESNKHRRQVSRLPEIQPEPLASPQIDLISGAC
jgi:hypothetical protein